MNWSALLISLGVFSLFASLLIAVETSNRAWSGRCWDIAAVGVFVIGAVTVSVGIGLL